MLNPYQILGVPDYSPISSIKLAFRSLSAKYHPDVAGNDEQKNIKFLEITEAYSKIKLDIKDLYQFLGVERESGGDDIKAAFFRKREVINFNLKNEVENAASDSEKLKRAYSLIVSDFIDNKSQDW